MAAIISIVTLNTTSVLTGNVFLLSTSSNDNPSGICLSDSGLTRQVLLGAVLWQGITLSSFNVSSTI